MSLFSRITKPIVSAAVSAFGGDEASPGLQRFRMTQCYACPFLEKDTMSCGIPGRGGTRMYKGIEQQLCGCYVEDKIRLEKQSCPLNPPKW